MGVTPTSLFDYSITNCTARLPGDQMSTGPTAGPRRDGEFRCGHLGAQAQQKCTPIEFQSSGGAPDLEADFSREPGVNTCVSAVDRAGGHVCHPQTVSHSKGMMWGTSCQTFVIHTFPAVDPLIGELFVCPQTLEALCLHRMLGLPVAFSWERLPSPSPSRDVMPLGRVPWWPFSGKGAQLPAAVDPKTGRILTGRRLMEALRESCRQLQVPQTALELTAGTRWPTCRTSRGPVNNCQNDAGDYSLSEQPLCIGTYKAMNSADVGRATQLATTEIVQQGVQAAIRFYLWNDDATYLGFTKPMFRNTFGLVYGTYYCWSMRRSMRDVSASRSSPRVSPDDLARPFPKAVGPGSSHEAPTVEELLVLDGLRRALRVVEQLLEGRPFLGGSEADTVDAVVFAHLVILFSLPLPDSRELQAVLSDRGTLLQYCRRVQLKYKVWPAGPSMLFGVSSLSEVATGIPLRVHSWRQRRVASHGSHEDQQVAESPHDIYRLVWWLGAAACCATLLVIAGKTPLRLGVSAARVSSLGSPDLSNEGTADQAEVDDL